MGLLWDRNIGTSIPTIQSQPEGWVILGNRKCSRGGAEAAGAGGTLVAEAGVALAARASHAAGACEQQPAVPLPAQLEQPLPPSPMLSEPLSPALLRRFRLVRCGRTGPLLEMRRGPVPARFGGASSGNQDRAPSLLGWMDKAGAIGRGIEKSSAFFIF